MSTIALPRPPRTVMIQRQGHDGTWHNHTLVSRGMATAMLVDADERSRAVDADTHEPIDLFAAA